MVRKTAAAVMFDASNGRGVSAWMISSVVVLPHLFSGETIASLGVIGLASKA